MSWHLGCVWEVMQKEAQAGLESDFTGSANDKASVHVVAQKEQESGRLSRAGEWAEDMLKKSADWIERPKSSVEQREVKGFYTALRKEMKANSGRTSLLAVRRTFSSAEREVRFHLHRWKNVCMPSQT